MGSSRAVHLIFAPRRRCGTNGQSSRRIDPSCASTSRSGRHGSLLASTTRTSAAPPPTVRSALLSSKHSRSGATYAAKLEDGVKWFSLNGSLINPGSSHIFAATDSTYDEPSWSRRGEVFKLWFREAGGHCYGQGGGAN